MFATSHEYTTPTLTETTSYWVKVSNEFGSTDSDTATVTVLQPPSIITQPQSDTIIRGSTHTLTVVAEGDSILTYQWYTGVSSDDSAPITDATSHEYTTPTLTKTTSYWVKVSNEFGSTDSDTATVTIVYPPSIVTQPQSIAIDYDTSTSLSVVAEGDGTITYQWYEGEQLIDGATSNEFTTPNLTETTSYWVRVSSDFGSEDSNTATVTVAGSAPTITQQPKSIAINYDTSTTLSVSAEGDGTLTYLWYQDEQPIDGATSSDFTTPNLTETTSYWVHVSSEFGSEDSETAIVTIIGTAPVIMTQPQSIAIDYNTSTTLSISAEGDGTLAYQWYEGEQLIDGATANTYTTPALSQTTSYHVRVSSDFGSVNSNNATVTVQPMYDVIVSEDFENKATFDALWTVKGIVEGDKMVCNKDKDKDGITDKIIAYAGQCAFQFKGSVGEKTSIQTVIDMASLHDVYTLGAGNSLNLSFYANGKSGVNVKAKVRASYFDGTKAKINIMIGATNGYQLLTGSVDLTQYIPKVKLTFVNKSQSGKMFIDDVTLSATETQAVVRIEHLLPLPDVPEGFRK